MILSAHKTINFTCFCYLCKLTFQEAVEAINSGAIKYDGDNIYREHVFKPETVAKFQAKRGARL